MNHKPFSRLFASNTALFLGIIFVLSLLSLIVENRVVLALLGFGVWLVMTVYSFVHEADREKQFLEYVQTLSFHTENTTKDSLLRFPLPLSVIQLDGRVLWYNEQFKNSFHLNNVFDEKLQDIMDCDINLDTLLENRPEGVNLTVGGQHYRVLVNIVRSESSEIVAILYWIDETKYVKLRNMYEQSRPVACIVMIDNYDEVMQNTPDDSRAILMGTVEKKITDWANMSSGIIKKEEREKYFIVFEYRFLKQFTESKFDILDAVKSIQFGNKIPVTVSIGIGTEGDSLLQDDVFARNAIDMALGRGGDQVVIKNKKKFSYFGGNSKEIEKYTRVKTRVMAYALKQLISQADQIMIMGHKNADLDSFGAAVGMLSAAVAAHKPAYVVLETANAFTNKLLSKFKRNSDYINKIIGREQALSQMTPTTLLIVVDVFRPVITELPELLEKTENVVVIDHHRKNAEYITNASLAYHEPSASSASEMVTELLQYINDGASISPPVAEALYAGIELDTKSFTFKTGVRTFEAAAYLRRHGVDSTNIKLLFQNEKAVYSLRTDIVKNAKLYKEGIAISGTKYSCADIQSISAAAADELLDIEGIKASFTMCFMNGITYISGRSLGGINVQFILENIGGGGHISVAGAQLECGLEEAEKTLKTAIDKYLEDNRKD